LFIAQPKTAMAAPIADHEVLARRNVPHLVES